MKYQTTHPIPFIKLFITLVTGAALSLLLISFTVHKRIGEDFLKQLGITKSDADSRIGNSLLGGSLDYYGIKNLKNIALGNRSAITKDLLVYTKQYTGSAAFIKEYNAMREKNKPVKHVVQTPEELQKGQIESNKKAVADMEASLKKADASMKSIFENSLQIARKQLQEAEDPNNRSLTRYRNGYPKLVKDTEAGYQQSIAEWELKYPSNQLLYVKKRLQQFMDETKDVDFSAELYEKNGKKYFTNPDYEHKGNRWKMVFRAGKEVVEPARAFVQEWIQSIK